VGLIKARARRGGDIPSTAATAVVIVDAGDGGARWKTSFAQQLVCPSRQGAFKRNE